MRFPKQTRREFCGQACRGASLVALGGALGAMLESCGSGGGSPTSPSSVMALPRVSGTAAAGSVTVTIDVASPLAAVGSAALVQAGSGFLLVAHTGQDTWSALSATCTHQACTITGFGGQTFVCPCHGSQFDTRGRALTGPARGALTQYPTQFSGNVLTITG